MLLSVSPIRSSESRRSSRLRSTSATLRRSSSVIVLKALPSRPASPSVAALMLVSRSPLATRSAAAVISAYGWLRLRATTVTSAPAATAPASRMSANRPLLLPPVSGTATTVVQGTPRFGCATRAVQPSRSTRPFLSRVARTTASVWSRSSVESTTSSPASRTISPGVDPRCRMSSSSSRSSRLATTPVGPEAVPRCAANRWATTGATEAVRRSEHCGSRPTCASAGSRPNDASGVPSGPSTAA